MEHLLSKSQAQAAYFSLDEVHKYPGWAREEGNLRETFFQNQLLCRHEVNIPDSFTVRDDMVRPAGKALPLWMFGLMY
jgi:hypothetical protein